MLYYIYAICIRFHCPGYDFLAKGRFWGGGSIYIYTHFCACRGTWEDLQSVYGCVFGFRIQLLVVIRNSKSEKEAGRHCLGSGA